MEIKINIVGLDGLIAALNNLAASRGGQPVQSPQPPVQPPQPPVQPQAPMQQVTTQAPTYTLDDLSRAAVALMESGKPVDLPGLLAKYGVMALPQLTPEQYGAFATDLRGLGAQI